MKIAPQALENELDQFDLAALERGNLARQPTKTLLDLLAALLAVLQDRAISPVSPLELPQEDQKVVEVVRKLLDLGRNMAGAVADLLEGADAGFDLPESDRHADRAGDHPEDFGHGVTSRDNDMQAFCLARGVAVDEKEMGKDGIGITEAAAVLLAVWIRLGFAPRCASENTHA